MVSRKKKWVEKYGGSGFPLSYFVFQANAQLFTTVSVTEEPLAWRSANPLVP